MCEAYGTFLLTRMDNDTIFTACTAGGEVKDMKKLCTLKVLCKDEGHPDWMSLVTAGRGASGKMEVPEALAAHPEKLLCWEELIR